MKMPMFKQSPFTKLEDLETAAMHMDPKEFTTHYKNQIEVININLQGGNGKILFYNVEVQKNYTTNVTLVWEKGTLKETSY